MSARENPVQSTGSEVAAHRLAVLLRLQAPAAQLTSNRRTLPQSPEARLDAILAEIDETVLPRVLHLKGGGQDLARLTVSHRRLIDIELPGPAAAPVEPEVLAEALAERLLRLAQNRAALSLSSMRRSLLPDHAESACSVTSLRLALAQAATLTRYDRLLRQIETQSTAMTQWDFSPDAARFSGAESWMKPLQALAKRFASMGDTRLGPPGTQGAAIPIAGRQVVIVASLGKRGFAALMPIDTGLRIISDWQVR